MERTKEMVDGYLVRERGNGNEWYLVKIFKQFAEKKWMANFQKKRFKWTNSARYKICWGWKDPVSPMVVW